MCDLFLYSGKWRKRGASFGSRASWCCPAAGHSALDRTQLSASVSWALSDGLALRRGQFSEATLDRGSEADTGGSLLVEEPERSPGLRAYFGCKLHSMARAVCWTPGRSLWIASRPNDSSSILERGLAHRRSDVAGFIFFIDSLLALCAAATRDWGKLFPCVHHICYYTDSCSEARHDARERLLCRSLHALDCQRRLAPMQYPLTTGVLQGIPSAGSLSAGHASARCLIRYRMFGTRRCPRWWNKYLRENQGSATGQEIPIRFWLTACNPVTRARLAMIAAMTRVRIAAKTLFSHKQRWQRAYGCISCVKYHAAVEWRPGDTHKESRICLSNGIDDFARRLQWTLSVILRTSLPKMT